MPAKTASDSVNNSLSMPTLRQAREGDLDHVRRSLLACELPVDDLSAAKLERFLLAEDGDEIVGLIGLELFGTTGLLRSLVVEKRARSRGLGGKLVGALEAAAQAAGVTDLWLLTIDAERFFERHGYEIVARRDVPEAIRQTEEFGELCPDSAFLMTKSLK